MSIIVSFVFWGIPCLGYVLTVTFVVSRSGFEVWEGDVFVRSWAWSVPVSHVAEAGNLVLFVGDDGVVQVDELFNDYLFPGSWQHVAEGNRLIFFQDDFFVHAEGDGAKQHVVIVVCAVFD